MADFGISEFLLTLFGADAVGTLLWNIFEGVTAFLGEEGSWLMLEIVPNLQFSGIETIYEASVLGSDGIVTGFGPAITKIAGVDQEKLLRFVQIISQKMVENGIAWVSEAGESFFIAFMEKLNEYKGAITVNAVGALATTALLKYTSQGKTPEDKNIEKESEEPMAMRGGGSVLN